MPGGRFSHSIGSRGYPFEGHTCGVTSLCRLWQRQGKQNEPPRLRAEICDWFTEGFDTYDWHEANALWHELG